MLAVTFSSFVWRTHRRDEWLWVLGKKAFLCISCMALGKSLNFSGPQLPYLENGLLITTSEVTGRTNNASLWDGPLFLICLLPTGQLGIRLPPTAPIPALGVGQVSYCIHESFS